MAVGKYSDFNDNIRQERGRLVKNKQQYEYIEPVEMTFKSYLQHEVPELAGVDSEKLNEVFQIYAQSAYYVNGNYET